MLTAALKQFGAELGMARSEPGYLAAIRVGALPAFLLIPFADRIGRRRVFLLAVAATSTTTFLTAFVQDALQFTLLQMLNRTFFVVGTSVTFVILTEEFPAAQRGWGIGMLAALGVSGHGLAAVLFGFIDVLPYGWRFLYAVGIVPVVLLPFFARRVPETARFEDVRRARHLGPMAGRGLLAWLAPIARLLRSYPARAGGVMLAAGLASGGTIAAFQFTGLYTQEVLAWRPWQYSTMFLVGGAIGIGGHIVAGHLGDRIGRRLVGFGLLAVFPVFATAFYLGPGWLVPPAWACFVFSSQGGRTILRAFSTELFPTSQRGTASGLFTLTDALGSALGLFALSLSVPDLEAGPREAEVRALAGVIPYLSLSALVGGTVLLLFPETRRRELEAISEERGA